MIGICIALIITVAFLAIEIDKIKEDLEVSKQKTIDLAEEVALLRLVHPKIQEGWFKPYDPFLSETFNNALRAASGIEVEGD